MIVRFFELFIGLRYTRAKRRNHFISFISMTSMCGIALGVAALIIVLSVMNGFQTKLRTRILGVAAHVEIIGNGAPVAQWQRIAALADRNPQVIASAPYIEAQGLLTHDSVVQGVMVEGIKPDSFDRVTDIASHMKSGSLSSLKPGLYRIVIGSELANALGVEVGDHVTLVAPEGQITPAGLLPRLRQFTVGGIFKVGMYEYDYGLALMSLRDAATLYRIQGVTGIRLRLHDLYKAPQVSAALARELPPELNAVDWTQQHASFFRAIGMEKNVMFIILLLIVAVAAFNIVSTLIMMVTDKQSDIAILRTLGASPASVMAIFIVQGILIGVIGTLIGVGFGILVARNIDVIVPFIEHVTGVHFLSRKVYYISEVPSRLEWHDVYVTALVSMLLSFLATLYPSWRASRTNPAEALRYE
ncbi:MAG: lipoprotein-releasing ABC transporter permease subunit [Proteobacteria bacterium]|nr:lipoprotein-releasing ABC transporter permease subunit [Pseudomonadota bacterium]MDE3208295.1 lipoprotein-releasing ABC transporter permease subunit [Pseudomonadota bacterium]